MKGTLVGFRKFAVAALSLGALVVLTAYGADTEAYVVLGTIVSVYLGGQSWVDRVAGSRSRGGDDGTG